MPLNYYDPTIQSTTLGEFDRAAANAMPSQGEFDTASNRIQSRVAAQTKANDRTNQGRVAGLGRAGSGNQLFLQANNQANSQGALATGLANLESEYAKRRQEGAGILSGIAQSRGNFGTQVANANLGSDQLKLDDRIKTGELKLGQDTLKEDKRVNDNQFLKDAFANMVLGGNLFSGNAADPTAVDANFNKRMNDIINQMFGKIGLGTSGLVGNAPSTPATSMPVSTQPVNNGGLPAGFTDMFRDLFDSIGQPVAPARAGTAGNPTVSPGGGYSSPSGNGAGSQVYSG